MFHRFLEYVEFDVILIWKVCKVYFKDYLEDSNGDEVNILRNLTNGEFTYVYGIRNGSGL